MLPQKKLEKFDNDMIRNAFSGLFFDIFVKKSSSLFSISTRLHLRNRKHVPCFYRVIKTRVEVW